MPDNRFNVLGQDPASDNAKVLHKNTITFAQYQEKLLGISNEKTISSFIEEVTKVIKEPVQKPDSIEYNIFCDCAGQQAQLITMPNVASGLGFPLDWMDSRVVQHLLGLGPPKDAKGAICEAIASMLGASSKKKRSLCYAVTQQLAVQLLAQVCSNEYVQVLDKWLGEQKFSAQSCASNARYISSVAYVLFQALLRCPQQFAKRIESEIAEIDLMVQKRPRIIEDIGKIIKGRPMHTFLYSAVSFFDDISYNYETRNRTCGQQSIAEMIYTYQLLSDLYNVCYEPFIASSWFVGRIFLELISANYINASRLLVGKKCVDNTQTLVDDYLHKYNDFYEQNKQDETFINDLFNTYIMQIINLDIRDPQKELCSGTLAYLQYAASKYQLDQSPDDIVGCLGDERFRFLDIRDVTEMIEKQRQRQMRHRVAVNVCASCMRIGFIFIMLCLAAFCFFFDRTHRLVLADFIFQCVSAAACVGRGLEKLQGFVQYLVGKCIA